SRRSGGARNLMREMGSTYEESARLARQRTQPFSFKDHFGPSGEINAVVAPIDALRAAGRDDLRITRAAPECGGGNQGGARAGAGRRGRSHAAFPDENADGSRRLDLRELNVGALGEHRVL